MEMSEKTISVRGRHLKPLTDLSADVPRSTKPREKETATRNGTAVPVKRHCGLVRRRIPNPGANRNVDEGYVRTEESHVYIFYLFPKLCIYHSFTLEALAFIARSLKY